MTVRSRLLLPVVTCLLALSTGASGGVAENLARSAQSSYQEGLQQMDPDLYWESVGTLIQLFEQYPESTIAKNNYLTAVEICLIKIGDTRALQAAEEILRGYLAEYDDPYDIETRKMHLKLVQTLLIYGQDPNAAANELTMFFSRYKGHLEPAEEVEVRLIEASIERKQGDFAAARRLYGIAAQQRYDPEEAFVLSSAPRRFDREIQFCQELEGGAQAMAGPHAFYGIKGVNAAQIDTVKQALEEVATELGMEFGFALEAPLTVYVFTDARRIKQFTGQEGPWVSALDGDLYVTPQTPLRPFLVQVFGTTFGRRPPSQVPLFLAEGFPSAFVENPSANRQDAARMYKMFGGRLSPNHLADEAEYRALPDRAALAASFVRELIDEYGIAAFGRLYGGLEVITMKGETPVSYEAYEADPERYEDHVDLDALGRAFRAVTGDSMDQIWRDFSAGLESEAQDMLTEFESRGGRLGSATVANGSAGAALESWFDALQKGDVDALRDLATVPFREELDVLIQSYEEAGILEEARLWSMAIPYSGLTYEEVGRNEIGPGNVQVSIVMKRDGEAVRTSQVLLFSEDGSTWRVAHGL